MTWNLEALSSILQNDAAVKVVLSSESGPELCGALHRVRQLRSGDSSNVRVADDAILFIGTPHMTSLEDMATHNLYISGEGGDARIIPLQFLLATGTVRRPALCYPQVKRERNSSQ